jgi:hypothetical protein
MKSLVIGPVSIRRVDDGSTLTLPINPALEQGDVDVAVTIALPEGRVVSDRCGLIEILGHLFALILRSSLTGDSGLPVQLLDDEPPLVVRSDGDGRCVFSFGGKDADESGMALDLLRSIYAFAAAEVTPVIQTMGLPGALHAPFFGITVGPGHMTMGLGRPGGGA